MGYNTTLVIYNDQLSRLELPDAGKRILDAIENISERDYLRSAHPGNDPERPDLHNHLTNFGFGIAVEHHHADSTAVVHVGGNYGERAHLTFGYRFRDPEMQLRMLEEQAARLGYKLVKNSNPKETP